jgi:hypothetical protein
MVEIIDKKNLLDSTWNTDDRVSLHNAHRVSLSANE